MKKILLFTFLSILTLPVNAGQTANKSESIESFIDMGFGMFIHWSVDSQLGAVISHSLAGASADYCDFFFNELPHTFNPKKFDPEEWAVLARLAGMQYVVFTVKHHSGFCMFPTHTTDFCISSTPFRRDITSELVDAFRAQGIKVGFYYSPEDFNFLYRQGIPIGRLQHEMHYPVNNQPLMDYDKRQLQELLTNYGPIDVLFFDGPAEGLKEYAWSIQPDVMITRGEITTPEQTTPDSPLPSPWEACWTMGTDWQYKPTNDPQKDGTDIIKMLIEIRAKGGNFLLNVGPRPDGELQIEQESLLREIALWNTVNHEAIHGVRTWPVTHEGSVWYTASKDGRTVYAFITDPWDYRQRREFVFPSITGGDDTRVSVLGHAGELLEYSPDADAAVRWEATSLGLVVSAVRGQRLYTDNHWPNPVVLKLENVEYAGRAQSSSGERDEVQKLNIRKNADVAKAARSVSCQLPADVSGNGSVQPVRESVDFTQVDVNDNFWRPRINTNAEVSIPYILSKCEEEGRFANLRRAAGLEEGGWRGHYGFDDSDVFKVMEGMAYTYNVTKDPALDRKMDEIIGLIGAAQEEDGYLYTAYQLKANDYAEWLRCCYIKERYDNIGGSHELYNMGHMYEAAVAHYIATGKRSFLDIAVKSADHIYNMFGPGKTEAIPGHPEIEIGLIKLFRVTGESKYMELSKLFMDRRGTGNDKNGLKVTDMTEARGHAVRANYLLTAMTETALLLGDEEYAAAVDSVWNNVVNTKMYITGGCGAKHVSESYEQSYFLPNVAYAETCAAIAGVYWCHKMFLLHGESKYIDVLERMLYNGVISGVSLDGTKFFYSNPMTADGTFLFKEHPGRFDWFRCSCCPTNMCRFLSSLSGYVYVTEGDAVYENLYISGKADIRLPSGSITLTQSGNYPWDGNITTTVGTESPVCFSLRLRIPGWATGHPVPGGLYSYIDASSEPVTLTVNGRPVVYKTENGYAVINRRWRDGDKVEINLPMPVREVIADPKVEADRGLEALERGPIVYCFEEADNGRVVTTEGDGTLEKALESEATVCRGTGSFEPHYDSSFLGGTVVLSNGTLTAVPYCVWDNRGDGQMSVWLRR